MCGRITQTTNAAQVAQEFSVTRNMLDPARVIPRYNVAPSQPVMVVRNDPHSGERALDFLLWGLIPSWSKDPAKLPHLINARVETVAEKPSFKGPFRYRRCLVPADGFYEWKRDGQEKQPFFIHRPDGHALAIAAIWEEWEPSDGSLVETFALLTQEADVNMAQIHDRMPVMLGSHDFDLWLDPKRSGREVLPKIHATGTGDLAFTPVSKRVNSAANDDPQLIEPVIPPLNLFGGAFG